MAEVIGGLLCLIAVAAITLFIPAEFKKLRMSMEQESLKTQALLAEIRDKLGK